MMNFLVALDRTSRMADMSHVSVYMNRSSGGAGEEQNPESEKDTRGPLPTNVAWNRLTIGYHGCA